MPKETKFKKKTEHYIETGSYEGYSIQLAIDSGFSKIYSIELFDKYYNYCCKKFEKNNKVTMIKGNSGEMLQKLLNDNKNTNFTYWLDAHTSDNTPLIQELETILSRGIDDELIYIDDMRLYRNFNENVNIEKIEKMIMKYKPNATILHEGDSLDNKDILVIEY